MLSKFVRILPIITLLFLTGCWDKIEIEERAFVIGIAIDSGEEKNDSNQFIEMTQQVIVPAPFTSSNSYSNDKAYRNLTKSGDNIFDIYHSMDALASRYIDSTHLELVILSEDVVKEPNTFANLMDVFLREMEMRRTIKIAIASGEAKKLLNVKHEYEQVPAIYINELLQDKKRPIITRPLKLGDIQENFLSKSSFVVPQLREFNSDSVEYEGVAIYHGLKNKVVGNLSDEEATGLIFIRGETYSGSINTTLNDNKIANEILNVKRDVVLTNKDTNNLKFDVTISVEAGIAEVFGGENILNEKNIEKIKNALEVSIEKITKNSVKKLQNDYHADVIKLNQYLYMHHYKLWNSIKDDWDAGEDYFSKSNIDVNVNVTIKKFGNINKAHQ